MKSWVFNSIPTEIIESSKEEVNRRLLTKSLEIFQPAEENNKELQFVAEALELGLLELLNDSENIDELRLLASEAFQIRRVIPLPTNQIECAKSALLTACLGVIGDKNLEAARFLKNKSISVPTSSEDWGEKTLAVILDAWIRAIRKDGWQDLNELLNEISILKNEQKSFEENYLKSKNGLARNAAWELIAYYHLAKGAEIFGTFVTQGFSKNSFDTRIQIETQIDNAINACRRGGIFEIEYLCKLLERTSKQLVDNSIWTITRGVSTSVNKFVKELVNSSQPIFEMLPPQRHALREQGLLGSGHRAVVVSLPTSSGKTVIAQFRILEALNQFEHQQGWVAYIAPTRALVNQVCSQLRKDFSSLGINVERVSPALEVDSLEKKLLLDNASDTAFKVLVTTPEKLDLLLRSGWETKIGRPLSLVVVDEAHNISDPSRGIKLELLLSTINRECENARFLLLTPFIDNGKEIARWLSPDSFNDIQLSFHWQPNDRAIGYSMPEQGTKRGNFSLSLHTLLTSKQTLSIKRSLLLSPNRVLGLTWSKVKTNANAVAASSAQLLKKRGPVIVVCSRPDWTWSLARNFVTPENNKSKNTDIRLVQKYLAQEFGESYELISMLNHGVGVHHSGLSDETRNLMEWLLQKKHLEVMVATTTIAQGVNYPVSSVVLAHYQRYDKKLGMVDMPLQDFWNLAGRVGRAGQSEIGIVALAAPDEDHANKVKHFLRDQQFHLNSTLIGMIDKAMTEIRSSELHKLVFKYPEWSSFLQYLVHSYSQLNDPTRFGLEIEQVLRGTLGFQSLRKSNPKVAQEFASAVRAYSSNFSSQPVGLVDSTGFSLESINRIFYEVKPIKIEVESWDSQNLFSQSSKLGEMMGVLLKVPELREQLEAVYGGLGNDTTRMARIISDWVNGMPIKDLAKEYFSKSVKGKILSETESMTECCSNVFGKLVQTTAWGLAALQSITIGEKFEQLSDEEQTRLHNVPAKIFYGVKSDSAVALRLLGVPRSAAEPLVSTMSSEELNSSLPILRKNLESNPQLWTKALGTAGESYSKIWKVLEGLE